MYFLNRLVYTDFIKNVKMSDISILTLIALSFALSDWMLGLFTFTEVLLFFILPLLLVTKRFTITMKQVKLISYITFVLILHTIYQLIYIQSFNLRVAVFAFIKMLFYLVAVMIISNYISNGKARSFLMLNNYVAVLIGVVGAYIAFAVYAEIYLEVNIPYESLLRFTRLDGHLFRASIPIVRMKSIFKEPAHLGFYLNTLLMVNLHNKVNIKVPSIINVVLIIVILSTLSYSSVVIMFIILFVKLVTDNEILKTIEKNKYSLYIGAVILAVVVYYFRDELYITLISRTMELITGNEASGYERIVLSWRFIEKQNLLSGIGLMQTPGSIWNIPAYILTELGLFGFMLYVAAIMYLIYLNTSIGIVFIVLNFAKGGYLSSSFWFLIIMVIIYNSKKLWNIENNGTTNIFMKKRVLNEDKK